MDDLQEQLRRELRLLFMDLATLAKAKGGKKEIIIPALPQIPERRRRAT